MPLICHEGCPPNLEKRIKSKCVQLWKSNHGMERKSNLRITTPYIFYNFCYRYKIQLLNLHTRTTVATTLTKRKPK
jgi:hypothetical protein